LISIYGRLYFALTDFLARRPVEDPFLFISFVTSSFWILGSSAGFHLVRSQKYSVIVVPVAISLLVVHGYNDSITSRIWFIALFALLSLLLLGRLNYLNDKKSWKNRRVFLSPDTRIDLTGIIAIFAIVLIFFAWIPPAGASSFDSASRAWSRFTKPWRNFTDKFENAVNPLESPSGGKRGEFFGSEINLGTGFPLSDTIMFTVTAPDQSSGEKPPRYYWRGRSYDYYIDDQWYTTGASIVDYSPVDDPSLISMDQEGVSSGRFSFTMGNDIFSLIYTPSQAIWISRPGSTFNRPTDKTDEILSWFAYPNIRPGETYQVNAIYSNPNINQLIEAGTEYPAWVKDKYLQLPENFSPKITETAIQITKEATTPFEKAALITGYLRSNIEYAESIPEPPRNKDRLEWVLFEYKKAYCVYYSTSEILMLRSLGIPARLAVGFSQGEADENNRFIVRRYDAHAWPEVYFPGIGWVEFEPTGNQPELNRPVGIRNSNELDEFISRLPNLENLQDILEDPSGVDKGPDQLLQNNQGEATSAMNTNLYLSLGIIGFSIFSFYFGWRYSVPKRIPLFLKNTYEKSGIQTPNWVANWDFWVNASATQRAFESVNFALRLLDGVRPNPDTTPLERVKRLSQLLPDTRITINSLLDEHQTSLYTSRKANVMLARRAAFRIRLRAIRERIRYTLDGAPTITP